MIRGDSFKRRESGDNRFAPSAVAGKIMMDRRRNGDHKADFAENRIHSHRRAETGRAEIEHRAAYIVLVEQHSCCGRTDDIGNSRFVDRFVRSERNKQSDSAIGDAVFVQLVEEPRKHAVLAVGAGLVGAHDKNLALCVFYKALERRTVDRIFDHSIEFALRAFERIDRPRDKDFGLG